MSRAFRYAGFAGATVIALLGVTRVASAQTSQVVQFGVGGVFPRGFDSRTAGDVLVADLVGTPMPGDPSVTDALLFEIKDFRSTQILGEWSVRFSPYMEVGVGVGLYQRTVPSIYADVLDLGTGADVEQALKLRVVPITGVIRFMPFGQSTQAQPYIGAGISALNFRYSEAGDFVDTSTLDIFTDEFVATGTAMGGVVLGGVRVPFGPRSGVAFEGRYQFGAGKTGGEDNGFLDDKIDLSGGQLNVMFFARF